MTDPVKVRTTHLYVIRIWQEEQAQPALPPLWRAWVEDPRSGQRWGFAGAEAVLVFLRGRITEERARERET